MTFGTFKLARDRAKEIVGTAGIHTAVSASSLYALMKRLSPFAKTKANPSRTSETPPRRLTAAIDGLEKGAVGSKEEIENIIGSIGEINEAETISTARI